MKTKTKFISRWGEGCKLSWRVSRFHFGYKHLVIAGCALRLP